MYFLCAFQLFSFFSNLAKKMNIAANGKIFKSALTREGFYARSSSRLCSEHFSPEDFDRTGQTIRIRDGAVLSVFCFPAHLLFFLLFFFTALLGCKD